MPFPYYEQIAKEIASGALLGVEYPSFALDSKKQKRAVFCVLKFPNGIKRNIYKGVAKSSRLEAIFKALEKEGIFI